MPFTTPSRPGEAMIRAHLWSIGALVVALLLPLGCVQSAGQPAGGPAQPTAALSPASGPAAPATAPTPTAAPPAPVTLKGTDFGLLADAITYLGLERGYFAEQGVDLDLARVEPIQIP